MADILRAREAFSLTSKINGLPRIVNPGDLVAANDPDVKGREHFFEKVEVSVARANRAPETASAAPGERRDRSKMTKAQREAADKAEREDEKTPPQGAKNFDPPPQAIDGPEPEPPGPPTTGAVNFDPKPQQVDGPENTEPEPTGEKSNAKPPQKVDGGEPKKGAK